MEPSLILTRVKGFINYLNLSNSIVTCLLELVHCFFIGSAAQNILRSMSLQRLRSRLELAQYCRYTLVVVCKLRFEKLLKKETTMNFFIKVSQKKGLT